IINIIISTAGPSFNYATRNTFFTPKFLFLWIITIFMINFYGIRIFIRNI
ncbi:hypothetical protein GLOIN_2v1504880, partial [Rhizophagus irregularis DAOM 181602=DAOM 197198]